MIPKNECEKHKDRIVLWGSSSGNCIKCGDEIYRMYIPCDKVCTKCSEELNICVICGDELIN